MVKPNKRQFVAWAKAAMEGMERLKPYLAKDGPRMGPSVHSFADRARARLGTTILVTFKESRQEVRQCCPEVCIGFSGQFAVNDGKVNPTHTQRNHQ